jgi:hypothetical protein
VTDDLTEWLAHGVMRGPSPWARLRIAAAKSLGELREPQAVEPILALLAEDDLFLNRELPIPLGRIGDVRAMPALLQLAREKPGILEVPRALELLLKGCAAVAPSEALLDVLRLKNGVGTVGGDCIHYINVYFDDAKDLAEAELRRRGVYDASLFDQPRESKTDPWYIG